MSIICLTYYKKDKEFLNEIKSYTNYKTFHILHQKCAQNQNFQGEVLSITLTSYEQLCVYKINPSDENSHLTNLTKIV